MYKIVVHPGSAHRDDFLAVSVLLADLDPVEVFRSEPTSDDLADPDTFVVDVGMAYDPSKHNFDHHQDLSLPCAFHLVMKHLGFHEDALSVFGWYPFMSMMDVRGPHKTAEHLGVDASVLLASSSPIDGYILSRFSRVRSLRKNDLLYEFMREMGREMIALIGMKKDRLELLKKEAEVVPVKQFKAVVSRIEDNPKLSMELYLRDLDDNRIVMCITPSVRAPGWELLRLGDSSLVDFRSIADSPEIRFVHANGYVATTETLIPPNKVIELAGRSIRCQEKERP
jgi:hypothetical protein